MAAQSFLMSTALEGSDVREAARSDGNAGNRAGRGCGGRKRARPPEARVEFGSEVTGTETRNSVENREGGKRRAEPEGLR